MKSRFRKYARWACAVALAAGLSLSGTAVSVRAATPEETLNRAWKAFNIGQYATTLRLVQPLASEGNPRAQVMLGRCYESGLGVEQNMETAAQWYALAAEQNDGEAQLLLAYAYQSGIGVPQDGALALQWMRRAADGGLPEAAYALSQYYARGRFVEKDQQAAFDWALKAAEGGTGRPCCSSGPAMSTAWVWTRMLPCPPSGMKRPAASALNPMGAFLMKCANMPCRLMPRVAAGSRHHVADG